MVKCISCGKDVGKTVEELCIDCYLGQYPPSSCRKQPWLYVINLRYKQAQRSVFDSKLMEVITSSEVRIEEDGFHFQLEEKELFVPFDVKAVDDIARRSGLVVGKWLVYRDGSEIDEVWRTIASSTLEGGLGVSAKVSTDLQRSDRRVICVYTQDYLDFDDVMSVREKLFKMGFTDQLCYKPDVYTYLGIYYQTTPLSACRYRV